MFIKFIIPCYNAENTVGVMVQSILSQSIQDFKIVLVDDLSTDGTWQILQKLATDYPDKIVAVQIDHKGYGGGARNFGMTVDVESEFVWFVDCDDYLQPSALQIVYDKIQQFPGKDVYYFGKFDDSMNIGVPWNKIVRTEYAKQFKFEEVPYFNDTYWSYCILNNLPDPDDEKLLVISNDIKWFDKYILHYTGHHIKYPKDKILHQRRCEILKSLDLKKSYLKQDLKINQQYARAKKRNVIVKTIYKKARHRKIKIVVHRY